MSTATKLQGVLDSKADIKEALTTRGMNPTDVLSTYADDILGIKCWQELAAFGIPQSFIDDKNTKFLSGVNYANEQLTLYPPPLITSGEAGGIKYRYLGNQDLVIFPYDEIELTNGVALWGTDTFLCGCTNLQYFKNNTLTLNLDSNVVYGGLYNSFCYTNVEELTLNLDSKFKDLTQIFAGARMNKLTINGSKLAFHGTFQFSTINELTLNCNIGDGINTSYTDFNSAFKGANIVKFKLNGDIDYSTVSVLSFIYMFSESGIRELTKEDFGLNNHIVHYRTFNSANSIIKMTVPLKGSTDMRQVMYDCHSLVELGEVDFTDALHKDGVDGFYCTAPFYYSGDLTRVELKLSEGIDLSRQPLLDEYSITYMINHLSYPTHSDYEKNGGTLRPTIKLHPSSYTYFISQQNLVDHATTLGYDIIQ